VEIIVKVDAKKVAEPATHVGRAVERTAGGAGIQVEEVFPGLKSGHSAGLVSLQLPDRLSPATREALLRALDDDEVIEYVEVPKPRRPR